jgi:hypothetical protein
MQEGRCSPHPCRRRGDPRPRRHACSTRHINSCQCLPTEGQLATRVDLSRRTSSTLPLGGTLHSCLHVTCHVNTLSSPTQQLLQASPLFQLKSTTAKSHSSLTQTWR